MTTNAASHDPTTHRTGAGWTLTAVAIATFMLMLDLTVVNVALADIRADFDSDFTALQWILDAYALGLAAVLLAAGSLADRIGRRRVFQAGMVVFTIASLACGLATGDPMLIAARFAQGLGGAVLFAVGPALLGHEFRGRARGQAFGVFGAVVGLAIAFGPLIGGALTEALSWRWIFLVNVPFAVLALAIGRWRMRESRDPSAPSVDWAGMASFSAALFFLVFALMRGESAGWTSVSVVGSFSASAALLVVFAVVQRRLGPAAMFDPALLRNRTFNGLSIVATLSAMSVMPALFLLISYVRNVLSYPAFASGVRFLPLTLTLFAAAVVAGMLTARAAPGPLVGLSQLLIALGLGAVLLVDESTGWTALIPAMVAIGFGMGLFNPPRAAIAIAVTTPGKAGMASGINETMQQTGMAIGVAAFGAVFHARVVAAFGETQLAAQIGDRQQEAAEAIAVGAGQQVVDAVPGFLTAAATDATRTAFITALHEVLLGAAALAALAAVVAVCTIRRGDMDESALAAPGVPVEPAPEPGPAVSAP
ncbi:MFS transporter [Nocardia rhizosphaerae]|uniref:MFS transporter n=1 Tax=Nocardia rhizosphaerae TaxID=1691571 RepID=A0ABV8LC36_9NOCA